LARHAAPGGAHSRVMIVLGVMQATLQAQQSLAGDRRNV
jgi:hypothetical protein